MWSLLSCVKDVVKSSLILTTSSRTLRLIMSLGIFLIPLTYRATILYTTTWHHLKPARFATNSLTEMTHLCPCCGRTWSNDRLVACTPVRSTPPRAQGGWRWSAIRTREPNLSLNVKIYHHILYKLDKLTRIGLRMSMGGARRQKHKLLLYIKSEIR